MAFCRRCIIIIYDSYAQGKSMPNNLEHRSHYRLQKHWEELKGDRAFPTENEIDPDALSDIWDSCFLISMDDVTRRLGYRYSYLGEDLIVAFGDDVKNPNVAMQMLATSGSTMVKKFGEVLATKAPVVDEAEFINLKNYKIHYRTSLLPLGYSDKGEITHIIGCMRWKTI